MPSDLADVLEAEFARGAAVTLFWLMWWYSEMERR